MLNKTVFTKSITALLFVLCAVSVCAGELIKLPTREGVTTNIFWHETPNAKATVLIFPGGAGGFGKVENGLPTGANFLVKTAQAWIDEGFNYAVFGKPSDMPDLDYADRISPPHLRDLKAVIQFLKTKTAMPIFIIGTSRGTISAVHLLINESDAAIAGGVLTSSVTDYKKIGAVPTQDLDKIKVPMLVVHHAQDACKICNPNDAPNIIKKLEHAPIKKLMIVSRGSGATGNPCEPQHFHGFVGMEKDTVHTIAQWIRAPSN